MKRLTLIASLRPGDRSPPLATSTPHGSMALTASATLSGSSPPARINRTPSGTSPASVQSNSWPEPGGAAPRRGRLRRAGRVGLDHPAHRRRHLGDHVGALVAVQLRRLDTGAVDQLD